MEELNNKSEYIKMLHHRKKHILLFLISIFLVTLIISTGVDIYNKMAVPSENKILVSGTGTVYAKPDLVLATFSVITEAKTVNEAISQNAQDMNKVIEFIKSQEVEDKDIKTTSFNIYPRYEYEQPELSYYPPGKRILVGYEVDQSVEVKIRSLEKVGSIIQGTTEAGANQIGNLQFTIDNQDEFKKQARQEAINKAKEKAQELASELGIKLVRIVSFNESSTMPYAYELAKESAMGIGGGEAIPQIETGENKIEVSVNITYEIR